jgi:Fis family transcriptional regulator
MASLASGLIRRRKRLPPELLAGGKSPRELLRLAVRHYAAAALAAREVDVHTAVLKEAERELFKYVLRQCQGNVCAAGRALGLHRESVRKRVGEFGLPHNDRGGARMKGAS